MTALSLSSYSREQLTDVLRIMKTYRASLMQVGHHAKIVDPEAPHIPVVRVEVPSQVPSDQIRTFAIRAIVEFFHITPQDQDITFIEKPDLVGGIRIFVDDDMMDLSFQRFAQHMTQLV